MKSTNLSNFARSIFREGFSNLLKHWKKNFFLFLRNIYPCQIWFPHSVFEGVSLAKICLKRIGEKIFFGLKCHRQLLQEPKELELSFLTFLDKLICQSNVFGPFIPIWGLLISFCQEMNDGWKGYEKFEYRYRHPKLLLTT